jgi:hypothetical protein
MEIANLIIYDKNYLKKTDKYRQIADELVGVHYKNGKLITLWQQLTKPIETTISPYFGNPKNAAIVPTVYAA